MIFKWIPTGQTLSCLKWPRWQSQKLGNNFAGIRKSLVHISVVLSLESKSSIRISVSETHETMEQKAAHSLSIFRRSRLRFWQQYQELWVLFCAKCGHYRLVNKVHRLGKLSSMFGWRRFDLYINDDLVGFIKSVPQTWLLYAAHSDSLTHEWQNRRSEISVDLSQQGAALRIHFLDLFVPPISERISVRHRYSSLV